MQAVWYVLLCKYNDVRLSYPLRNYRKHILLITFQRHKFCSEM